MPVEVILPRVDMDMERGKFSHWFAEEGACVEKGEPLFEIETDKAAMEVDAPASGVLHEVSAKPGDVLPVGTVIARIYSAGEAMAPPPARAAKAAPAPVVRAAVVTAPAMPAPSLAGAGLRATPKARRLAREAGVALDALAGSGPQGRVQARDVVAPSRRMRGLHREWLVRGPRAPLLLIHGFGADLNVWRRWLGRLPAGRGALALDLPGHGRSPLGARVEVEAFADEVAATLAAEGVGFAHVVAHSLGAAVAAALAARRPDLVGSLTLIAPAGVGPDIDGAFVAGFLAARTPDALRPWLNRLAVDPQALGDGLAELTLRHRADLDLGDAQARVAAALLPDGRQAFDARPALAAIRVPLKAIFGRDDAIVPVAHARDLPAGVAVHVLPGVGHMPHWEARDVVARLAADNAAAGDDRKGEGAPPSGRHQKT
jgi:pyruvate dehydrogenase E2 component (dihydrolipoamide acetyltransferase)